MVSPTQTRWNEGARKLLTSCRLSVRFSCPQLLKHAASAPGLSWPGGSPRANAPRTRHSCLCLRSSSSHSPTRLASRRALVRLRSTVTGKEKARCMSPTQQNNLPKLRAVIGAISPNLKTVTASQVSSGYTGLRRIPPPAAVLSLWSSVVSGTISAHLPRRSCQTRSTSSAFCKPRPQSASGVPEISISAFIGCERRLVLRGTTSHPPLLHYSDASTSPMLPPSARD